MPQRLSNGRFGVGNTGKPKGAKHKKTKAAQIKEKLEQLTELSLEKLQERLDVIEPGSVEYKEIVQTLGVFMNYVLPRKSEATEFTHDHVGETFRRFAEWMEQQKDIEEGQLNFYKGLMVRYLDTWNS